MSTIFIEANHVNKRFDTQTVLEDVSFTVKKGEIVGLLGPNGSGKTTMIRLLNGVIDPTSGSMKVHTFDPNKQGHEIRKMSGILTDGAGLYFEMSALENLKFFSKLYNCENNQRIEQLLEEFGLTDHQHKKVGTYSTGMKRRLGMIKAILHNPSLLFLDEPTNGLDPEGIHMVLDYMKHLNKQYGTTILVCSHILHQMESVCDQYLFLEKGKIIEKGTKEELEEKYVKEVYVKVETNAPGSSNFGYKIEKQEESFLTFVLPSKDHIPNLLQNLLEKKYWIHHVEIQNRDLEALYFQIRGGK